MGRTTHYKVEPSPPQRQFGGQPDNWKVKKGGATVKSFSNKQAAVRRAKQLAKKNNAKLTVFDSMAKSTTERRDYRSEDQKQAATRRSLSRDSFF